MKCWTGALPWWVNKDNTIIKVHLHMLWMISIYFHEMWFYAGIVKWNMWKRSLTVASLRTRNKLCMILSVIRVLQTLFVFISIFPFLTYQAQSTSIGFNSRLDDGRNYCNLFKLLSGEFCLWSHSHTQPNTGARDNRRKLTWSLYNLTQCIKWKHLYFNYSFPFKIK